MIGRFSTRTRLSLLVRPQTTDANDPVVRLIGSPGYLISRKIAGKNAKRASKLSFAQRNHVPTCHQLFDDGARVLGRPWMSHPIRASWWDVTRQKSTKDTTWIGNSRRRLQTSHRTFSPYFCVIGGTIPFKRRYSTSCP
jgi:hypothetical protein